MTAQDKTEQEPIAKIVKNASGQISIFNMDGDMFDVSKYVGATLYTSAPNAKAIRAAALMEAVDAMNNSHRYCSPVGTIQSIITQSDKDALRELMIEVAEKAFISGMDWPTTAKDNLEQIVDEVLSAEEGKED